MGGKGGERRCERKFMRGAVRVPSVRGVRYYSQRSRRELMALAMGYCSWVDERSYQTPSLVVTGPRLRFYYLARPLRIASCPSLVPSRPKPLRRRRRRFARGIGRLMVTGTYSCLLAVSAGSRPGKVVNKILTLAYLPQFLDP